MARRASSRISPLTIAASIVVPLLAIGLGYWLFSGASNPYRTFPSLDVSAYLDNANSLRGNVYRVDGTVANSLAWSPGKGRLISVNLGSDDRTRTDIIAIFVPAKFNQINLQKGQRYQFKVEIGKDGIIEAQDLRKS
jgi:hypothetical protein